jgi:AcrR family transcriptional regulator
MGSRDRRERDRAELREKILDAARELFAEYGYEGVSMRKIAQHIEYSPTSIYLHFADKETLFRELCYSDFQLLSREFAVMAETKSPAVRLRQIGEAYVRFGASHPFHYRMMFMTPPPVNRCAGEERLEQAKGNPETDAYAFLKWTVTEAANEGFLREDLTDIELVSQTLWAGVHGVTSLEIVMHGDECLPWRPLEDRARAMLDAVINGIARKEH